MRVMALDIGKVRVGIAISDPDMRVASPLAVLPTKEVLNGSRSFKNLVLDWEPELLVSGLPYSLDGEEGPQAAYIRQTAEQIGNSCSLPVEFVDERLSSSEAKRSMRIQGMSERDMRGKVDMIAAALFLQAWLDSRVE